MVFVTDIIKNLKENKLNHYATAVSNNYSIGL